MCMFCNPLTSMLRIPAACNGIYGYKPSLGIVPFIGYAASGWTGVNTGIPAVCGPMGRSMRDLVLFTETVRSHKPWEFDPAVIEGVMEFPLPPSLLERKPIVGILHHSDVMPHPPVRRAMRDAKAKLEAAGFETRDFTPSCPSFLDIRHVSRQLFTVDGFSYPKRELAKAGEPVVPSVAKLGYWEIPRKTHEEVWAWNTKKGAIQKAMLDAWQKLGIDVLITPVGPHTAVKAGDWTIDLYTVAWNVTDVSHPTWIRRFKPC
jgi:amidase